MDTKQRSLPRLAATSAIVVGLAAGSYGIASAASGNGSSAGTTTTTTPAQTTPVQGGAPAVGSGETRPP